MTMWIVSFGNSLVLRKDGRPTIFLEDAKTFPNREEAEAAITPEVRSVGGTGCESVIATRKPH